MKKWIFACALTLASAVGHASDAIDALLPDIASRTVVDTQGQSPIAQLGLGGNAQVIFGKFVTQFQTTHPGEVVIRQNGQAFIIQDKEAAFLFEAKGTNQVVVEKMRVRGQEVEDDKVSASFALFLLNLGAEGQKKG